MSWKFHGLSRLGFGRIRLVSSLWILNVKNFLEEKPKTQFKGFILNLYCLILEGISQIIYMVTNFFRIYNNIIYIVF